MLINGEKYACEACVRGHRVSNCQHSDRALQHIAKKGRPVSQCVHCRSLRKSRSAHVKCDCGEKTHAHAATKGPCPHLAGAGTTAAQEGDSQGEQDNDKDAKHCCCGHGGRCSCALKKEYLEAVPEQDLDPDALGLAAIPSRPRATTIQSDVGVVVTANGHHRPAHKHTAAHKNRGLPYVVPRANSIHNGLSNRSMDNLAQLQKIETLHGHSQIKDSMIHAQQEQAQRKVKSANGSPILVPSPTLDPTHSGLPPLDMNFGVFDFGFPSVGVSPMPPPLDTNPCAFPDFDPLLGPDLLSAASDIDWSSFDLEFNVNNDNIAISNFSQAQSFAGTFWDVAPSQPALTTTSTSGETSEVEDFGGSGIDIHALMAPRGEKGERVVRELGAQQTQQTQQTKPSPGAISMQNTKSNHGLTGFEESPGLTPFLQADFNYTNTFNDCFVVPVSNEEEESWMASFQQGPSLAGYEGQGNHQRWPQ